MEAGKMPLQRTEIFIRVNTLQDLGEGQIPERSLTSANNYFQQVCLRCLCIPEKINPDGCVNDHWHVVAQSVL